MHKRNLSIGLILIAFVILTPILSIANEPINFTMAQSNAPELTGTYKANDGGTYYIRQLGNDLVWAGVSSDDGHEWTNIFVGKVNGDTISGNWADVPRGHLQGSGTLTLKFTVSEFRINIQKTGGTGDFSGSQWEKVATVTTSPPQKSSTESEQNSGHQYTIKLDSTYITSKRAAYRDTDFVALSAKVNDQQPITNSKKLGDLDSGFLHPINIQVGPITVHQGQAISFDYVITNKHEGDSSTLSTLASATASILSKFLSNSNPVTAVSFPVIEKIVEQALPGWFVAGSCDGVVAADTITIPNDLLEQWTQNGGGSHQEKRDYYGGDTPVGCGSNSHYDVRWTVTKVS